MQNNDDKKQTGRLADNKASMRFRWFRSVAKKSADRLCVCLSAGSTRLGEGTERLLLLSVRVAWRASVRSAVSPVSRDSPRRNIQRGKFEAVHTRGTSWQPRLGAIVVDGWRFCFFHGSSIRRQKKKVPTKNKRRTKKKKKGDRTRTVHHAHVTVEHKHKGRRGIGSCYGRSTPGCIVQRNWGSADKIIRSQVFARRHWCVGSAAVSVPWVMWRLGGRAARHDLLTLWFHHQVTLLRTSIELL